MTAISLDTFAPDFVLAEIGVLGYAEAVRNEQREYSEETRRMLDDFCADVAEAISDLGDDALDFGADFSEIEERFFA